MPTRNSLYQRKPGRLAGEKKNFDTLIEKLASEQGYTKKQIAFELGVSITTVYQWSTGYTLTVRRETIERLKQFCLLMPKKPLPQFVAPMQASSVKEPFDSADWIFETKLDGYRAIAVIDSTGKARIWSRNRLPLEQKFPTVRGTTEEMSLRSTILDGEIVALDNEGIPQFQLLQKWQKCPTVPVVYVLFDLLWDNGRDLTGRSVIQRRERLQEVITPVAGIQVGGYLERRGMELFQLAKEKGLEGIIAKRKASTYQPGRRSANWLKIKSRPQQEFIVCGFTEGKGSRFKNFGALLLAGYRDGKLRYFGHSGSGFSEKGLKETLDRLRPLFTDKVPVWNPPKIHERIQWVEPKLVCEVAIRRMDSRRRTAADDFSRMARR
jgi:bifunctional non-homologous end joining protein LigD